MTLRHFKPNEFNDFGNMDTVFLEQLDEVRHRFGEPFVLTSDYRGGADMGMHGQGKAVDFHIKTKLEPYNQIIKMLNVCDESMKYYRLGYYPCWANGGGFHLDNKPQKLFWVAYDHDVENSIKSGDQWYVYYNDKASFLNACT